MTKIEFDKKLWGLVSHIMADFITKGAFDIETMELKIRNFMIDFVGENNNDCICDICDERCYKCSQNELRDEYRKIIKGDK